MSFFEVVEFFCQREKKLEEDFVCPPRFVLSLFYQRTSATAARPREPCWMTQPAASSPKEKEGKTEKQKKMRRPRVVLAPAEEEEDSAAARKPAMASLLPVLLAPACPPRSCCSLRLPVRLGRRVEGA